MSHSPHALHHPVGLDLEGEDEETADVTINIKELDDVLIKDVGNHIASSGK